MSQTKSSTESCSDSPCGEEEEYGEGQQSAWREEEGIIHEEEQQLHRETDEQVPCEQEEKVSSEEEELLSSLEDHELPPVEDQEFTMDEDLNGEISPVFTVESDHCECGGGDFEVCQHKETCYFYKIKRAVYEEKSLPKCLCKTTYRHEGDVCKCDPEVCSCEHLVGWRDMAKPTSLPPVLDASHPLMKKFQDTLRRFLERENEIARDEIFNLKEELRLNKETYSKNLETMYQNDHDTNQQRVMIAEYEKTLAKTTEEKMAMDQRVQELTAQYNKARYKLDQDITNEREANEELEALTQLCQQLEAWREDTAAEMSVTHRMSDKMRVERKMLAEEKRQLDMIVYALNNEVWRLESKLELFKKQLEIKQNEMDKVNDKVIAYAAELEDLELDKKRLVSLWNSVLVNIKQRDNVFDSVRTDYNALQDNYHTLLNNLEMTKKTVNEAMEEGRRLLMTEEKLLYDIANVTKAHDSEDAKRRTLETKHTQLTEALEMLDKDETLMTAENGTLNETLKSLQKEYDRKNAIKEKLENEILANLEECLLNDKAVEFMANGIKKMRELSRKQEIALMSIENQHAKMMLEIEVYRARQVDNAKKSADCTAMAEAKEREVRELEDLYEQNCTYITKKQRELDIMTKRYVALKEIFDMKTPQDRRIDEMEQQIRNLRARAEELQADWLRLQGHVVNMTSQHDKLVSDMNLVKKQTQICEQKLMQVTAECEAVANERAAVDRSLRDLRGRLEVLARNRKEVADRNQQAEKSNMAVTHEYVANLKDAENDILQLEEDIDNLEKEKINLSQELDRMQREALVWQRKGIQAVELKRQIKEAKSVEGEIGQMKSEIHKMTVRREQLQRVGEKLAEDLAQCIKRREFAMDKTRAAVAMERQQGPGAPTPQSQYRHRLRLAKADLARVTKEVNDSKAKIQMLQKEQECLDNEIVEIGELNAGLEEHVASLLRDGVDAERTKQWLLERVVRSQRLGAALSKAVQKNKTGVKKSTAVMMQELKEARAFNAAIRRIVDTMNDEYPFLQDRLAVISNTLNIFSPGNTPQFSDDEPAPEDDDSGADENVAEKPFCP
ncbi:Coiled-coil domain-containing protein 40 [Eumeta japonica]|uniref:Coiled-coil domain-containing protein 40 n=1 Tax=Eumeta variegata TaxID=151549 RepID=A0A4C1YL97_EUMVA|nr:Coiled-coil domain-containing protein 40 [Eumeta japonica]